MGVEHKMLWIGSYQSDQLFQKMLSRNIGQASGYASQKGLVKGFDAVVNDAILDTIGVISYPPYPIYPNINVKRVEWSRTGKSKDVCIGYINLKYFNYLFRGISLKKEVRNWAKSRRGHKNTIFVYEPSVAKLKSALSLKKKYGAKVFVIIPDVPELVNLGANKIIKIAKRVAAQKMRYLFNDVDGFILYSEHMAEYYNLSKDKWILMEGVFDPEEVEILYSPIKSDNNHPIRLMYCGALDEFRGIPKLLEAFDTLRDREYELWLTGAGRSDILIHEKAKLDHRIRHYGYLDSRDDVLKLQQQADILIHTRDVDSPAAPYCFPSKIFEYLVTGKPVISVDIPGIPRNYFDYMIRMNDMSVEEILKAIQTAVDMPSEKRFELGQQGKQFVLETKNSIVQVSKIMDFVETRKD